MWVEVDYYCTHIDKGRLLLKINIPYDNDDINSIVQAAKETAQNHIPEVVTNPNIMYWEKSGANFILKGLYPDNGSDEPEFGHPIPIEEEYGINN